MSQDTEQSIREWFHVMERCFQRLDYATARKLMADDVVAFSTRTSGMSGIDALVTQQWAGQLAQSPRLYLQLRSTPLGYFRRSGAGRHHVEL
jgi:hypothetical protein